MIRAVSDSAILLTVCSKGGAIMGVPNKVMSRYTIERGRVRQVGSRKC